MELLKSSCKYGFNKLSNKLNLKDFECKKILMGYNEYNGGKNRVRNIYVIPNTNKQIGCIEYDQKTGAIGYCYVDEDYRYKTLGTQMLDEVKEELRKNNIKKMYMYSNAKEIENKAKKDTNIKRFERGIYYSPLYEINIA